MGLYRAKEVWTGTLASSIPDGTTTSFTLSSSSGLTNGETYVFTIDRVDANGTKIPNKKEVIVGTVSGSNVINCQRGVEGTAQAHSAGAIVEILFTAKHWNDLIDGITLEHNQDGTHNISNFQTNNLTVNNQIRLINGYFRFNTSTDKLQFSNDGTTYEDIGGGGAATPTFTIVGTLTTGTGLTPLIIAPFALTIKKAFGRVKTAPAGASIIIDINKNGTSIWNTNQGNRLTIAAGTNSASQTSFDTTSLAEGNYLTLDIDQVGSTTAGADLTVEVYCEAT